MPRAFLLFDDPMLPWRSDRNWDIIRHDDASRLG